MKRVHPPVPDYKLSRELGEFHYCMPGQVSNHSFEEQFSPIKEKVPVNSEEQEINDYCPRTQLKKMFLNCGSLDYLFKKKNMRMEVQL